LEEKVSDESSSLKIVSKGTGSNIPDIIPSIEHLDETGNGTEKNPEHKELLNSRNSLRGSNLKVSQGHSGSIKGNSGSAKVTNSMKRQKSILKNKEKNETGAGSNLNLTNSQTTNSNSNEPT